MHYLKHRIILSLFALQGILPAALAQQDDSKNIIAVPGQMAEAGAAAWQKSLPTDGWVLLRFKEEGDRLVNLSHKDYVLHLWLNCTGNEAPGYLVEYSDSYRDGDYGGIDFIGSRRDDGHIIHFLLDGKDYNDPFDEHKQQDFAGFAAALKKAARLQVSVYDMEMNPETGKEEPKLNRSIDFKLAHSALLDKPVNCGN